MFHEFFAGSRLLDWPLVALGIFLAAFLAAVVYAVVGLRSSAKVRELSRLPFDDEGESREEEAQA